MITEDQNKQPLDSFHLNKSGALLGTVRVPGDKSISHRAVMLGSLARGVTRVKNFLPGQDCLSTIKCFGEIGVKCDFDEGGLLLVHGVGREGLREPRDVLDAGNSGTTMRLMLGILAGLDFSSVITGDKYLRERPMDRVMAPLSQMGASFIARNQGRLAPLACRGGNLKSINYSTPVASAQIKSAVLLAGLLAQGTTTVTEPHLSRDHTERMLEFFGADVSRQGLTVYISGNKPLRPSTVEVPGDISSAAFLMVAACLVPGSDIYIKDVGINPTRSGVITVLKEMGADLSIENTRLCGGEPVANIRVRHSKLKGATIGGSIIPRLIDEIPVLAVAGAFAQGTTVIRDARELRVKETDRIASVFTMLHKFGALVEEKSDGLVIRPSGVLRGAEIDSGDDHRIAMAAAVAALAAEGESTIYKTRCIDVSFPGFTGILNYLGAK